MGHPTFHPQAMNTPPSKSEIEETVIATILRRRDDGRKKYGLTMERTDLSTAQWMRHAKEEALDLAIYLQKLEQIETAKLPTSKDVQDIYEETRDMSNSDFVRVPTDEYLSLQKEVESLRGEVAEWKRSVESIALGSQEVEVPLKLALKKAKAMIDRWKLGNSQHPDDLAALEAISSILCPNSETKQ